MSHVFRRPFDYRPRRRWIGTSGDPTDAGTNTSVAVHSGVEALVDAATNTAVAVHTAAEALADAATNQATATHTGGEALADATVQTSTGTPDGSEAIADASSQTSTTQHSGTSEVTGQAATTGTGGLIGVDYFLAETIEAKRRKVPIRQRGLVVSRAVHTGEGEVEGYETPDIALVAALMD